MTRRAAPPIQPRRRLTALDWVLYSLVLAALVFMVWRVNAVLVYDWNWPRVFNFVIRYDEETQSWVANLLLQGLATTIRLAFWGTILAALIGLVMGYWRTCETLALRIISRTYVELIRNIPPLIFIFIFFFFIASQVFPVLGLNNIDTSSPWVDNAFFRIAFGDPRLFSNFLSGLICLALFEAAYITEIVRAGIQSVAKGQWEAGRAIGLSRTNLLRDIIFPQAIRKILPPLAGQFITLIKDSAIISLISVQELTFLATEVAASTTKVFETWIIVGAMYFGLCYFFAFVFARLERRAGRSQR
jgi:polar amino acid transport system permease protein